jgi:high-affinity nickel-transport protein
MSAVIRDDGFRRRPLLNLPLMLAGMNLAAWLPAALCFQHSPLLSGTALLAYSLGLRHAVDADHIAAIDSSVRKLTQQGERPIYLGLFFSLGHSTVVILGSVAIAATAVAFQDRITPLRAHGSLLGTLAAVVFLFAIAAANAASLRSSRTAYRLVQRGESASVPDSTAGSALLGRMLAPATRWVRTSWHLYPIGILFGLGFDTATEIGLLNISAANSLRGLTFGSLLIFPLLFAAGMSTVDSAYNALTLRVFDSSRHSLLLRLRYNIAVTTFSIGAAAGVGAVEALGVARDRLNLAGAFWDAIGALDANPGATGLVLILMLALVWAFSMARRRS